MANASSGKKLLGVRVSPQQARVLAAAAKREKRTVSNFVLSAALDAASKTETKREESLADIREVFREVNERFLLKNPDNPDIVGDLLADRRAEVAREGGTLKAASRRSA